MRNRTAISTYQLCRLHTDRWQCHTFNLNSAVSSQIKLVFCLYDPSFGIPFCRIPLLQITELSKTMGEKKRPTVSPNFPSPEKDTTVFPKCSKPVRTPERGLFVAVVETLRSLMKDRRLPKQQSPPFVSVNNASFKVNTEGIYIYIYKNNNMTWINVFKSNQCTYFETCKPDSKHVLGFTVDHTKLG